MINNKTYNKNYISIFKIKISQELNKKMDNCIQYKKRDINI